jgi:hypothetical protein
MWKEAGEGNSPGELIPGEDDPSIYEIIPRLLPPVEPYDQEMRELISVN